MSPREFLTSSVFSESTGSPIRAFAEAYGFEYLKVYRAVTGRKLPQLDVMEAFDHASGGGVDLRAWIEIGVASGRLPKRKGKSGAKKSTDAGRVAGQAR